MLSFGLTLSDHIRRLLLYLRVVFNFQSFVESLLLFCQNPGSLRGNGSFFIWLKFCSFDDDDDWWDSIWNERNDFWAQNCGMEEITSNGSTSNWGIANFVNLNIKFGRNLNFPLNNFELKIPLNCITSNWKTLHWINPGF